MMSLLHSFAIIMLVFCLSFGLDLALCSFIVWVYDTIREIRNDNEEVNKEAKEK